MLNYFFTFYNLEAFSSEIIHQTVQHQLFLTSTLALLTNQSIAFSIQVRQLLELVK